MKLRLALLTLFAGVAFAASLDITVILDTSLLMSDINQPFYLEFQLNDGSGTNDGNNTATLTNFNFYGGGPGLNLSTIGGASGSLDTTVTITDTEFFNQFYQEFSPGPRLSFDLNLTGAVDLGPQPDRFTVGILDCSFAGLPTTGPADELLGIDITSSRAIERYGGDASRLAPCTNTPGIPFAAPVVAPEPASFWLVGLAVPIAIRRFRAARAGKR